MPEWWTYRLSDFLMFSSRTYYRLFELYNRELWPGQLLAVALGLVLLALAGRRGTWQRRVVTAILVAAWAWVGWAFHWRRYATINLAAPYFAACCAIQAALLVANTLWRRGLSPPQPPAPDRIGLGIIFFALVLQPLIGPLLGRAWAGVELFGLAPDPTATATLGLLLAAEESWTLWVVPTLWCLAGGATLWAMAAPDAWVTPALATVALVTRAVRRRRGVSR
jgi:hypothetical protein